VATSQKPEARASGKRAIASERIEFALTGDHGHVDARTISIAAIPDPANVTALMGTHNVPRPPARVFVGRDTALKQLSRALDVDTTAVVAQAIYGLGGVGKSELALQYANGSRARQALTWWMAAEDQAQIQTGLADLAGRLCREIRLAGTSTEAAAWGLAWLQAHQGWLLVLDNVSEPDDIQPLLGQLTGGHILITTRRDTGWDQVADPICLDILDPGPAAALLIRRTGLSDQVSRNAADLIADQLGYLPLALDQAAAYIARTRISLPNYLQLLRQHPADMYAADSGRAQQTIARTWDISFEAIRVIDPVATSLLDILACFAPVQVPRVILGGKADPDRVATNKALSLLASYSLITLTADGVSMHRLVQAVLLYRQAQDTDAVWGGASPPATALEWLAEAIPLHHDRNVERWPLLGALVPHADHLASWLGPDERPIALGRVQNELGLYLRSQGQYADALRMQQSALHINESSLGPDHPDTASALGNLGLTYGDLGRYADALPLQERALAITEAALGPDHPDTAIRLGGLARTYRDLGRHADALPLKQRALAITEAALGPDHSDTAIRLGSLGLTYRDLGRHADALPLKQRALAITEAALGPDHPDTGIRLGSLGFTYGDLGRYADALPLQERALTITEAALGPDHPDTASALGDLALSYRDLGRYADALPLKQRALAIAEAALGPDHPDTAIRLGNLGLSYGDLGRYADALPLQERALAITEAALGPDHPDTAIRLGNLALAYGDLGRHADALPLQERALAITEAAVGPDHPDTIWIRQLIPSASDAGTDGCSASSSEQAL
jgi:tetratricopeptide (TPR) repeat protein